MERIELKEGIKKSVIQLCVREECEICGEPATHQLTFLLKNARSNPQSSAYHKDDCSWCSDDEMFVCDEHSKDYWGYAKEKDMEWCSDFAFGERFKHLFLHWKTLEEKLLTEGRNLKGEIKWQTKKKTECLSIQ